MGSGGRVGKEVPRRAQGDGDGRLAGRQDRLREGCLCGLEMRRERPDDDEVERRQPVAETCDVGLAWRRRQEDLLDTRQPAAEGRCQCRRDRRGRVGWRQVGGHRLDDGDPGVRGRLQRQQPLVITDEGDRTSCQLGGECVMFGAPDDVERRLGEGSQPAAQLVQPASRRSVVVGIDQASPLCLDEAFLQPFERCFVGGPEQHVLAGSQGGDRIDDLGRSLGQRVHVERIGDGHAVELQLPAQQVTQDRGETGWSAGHPPDRLTRSGRS